jgi:hypothetical protein
MAVSSSWIHGNTLTVETPVAYMPQGEEKARLTLTSSGPGTWVDCDKGRMVSWLHLSIPTVNPNLGRFETFALRRVFLVFATKNSSIENVHVYDGHHKLEAYDGVGAQGLALSGNYLLVQYANTFSLKEPRPIRRGIGLSFLVSFPTYTGGPYGGSPVERWLFVAGAGAEFNAGNRFISFMSDLITRLSP